MYALLIGRTLHFVGNLAWVGGLLAVMVLLSMRDAEPDAAAKGRLAARARRLAILPDVGALVTILAGLHVAGVQQMFREPWLHLKLLLIVGLLAVHVMVRLRTKRAVQGTGTFVPGLFGFLAVLALAVVYVAVFKPFVG